MSVETMRESSEEQALPPGWTRATLDQIALPPRPKIKPDPKSTLPFVGMDHIAPHSTMLTDWGQFQKMKSAGGHFFKGDVLYGRMRSYLNKVHRADFEGACSAEFIVFPRSDHLNGDYLKYLLHDRRFVNFAASQASGDRPRVDMEDIGGYKFCLAPKAEQQRIADKLDQLFSQIEKGEENLRRVEALVKRYRQSVLKAAVTGELTREWRQANSGKGETGEQLLQRILKARRKAWETAEIAKLKARGKAPKNDTWKQKYKEPEPPDTSDLPELPEGWVWASIGQLGIVSGGLTKNSKRDQLSERRPYLRVGNVYANELRLDDVQTIGVREAEIEKVSLLKGDLLVVEGNGSVDQIGRVAVWDGSVPNCVHQNHLIKVRLSNSELIQFSLIWLLSPHGRKNIRKVASSTAGLHTLSISKVSALTLPVPPLRELRRIVSSVEIMNSNIARVESEFRGEARKASSLRQSILRAAFSGKLVPQDPNDEPANLLLERIAAERAAQDAGKPKRGRRPKRKEAAE